MRPEAKGESTPESKPGAETSVASVAKPDADNSVPAAKALVGLHSR